MLLANAPEKKKPVIRNTHPVMIYLEHDLNAEWEEFSRKNRMSKSQVAREGIQARIRQGDNSFTGGYNTALEDVAEHMKSVEAFKMRFPSGKSFLEFLEEHLASMYREQADGG